MILSRRYNNLKKEEPEALFSWKNKSSIPIKGAHKVSAVVVWYSEDYLKEVYKQFDDKEMYEQVASNSSILVIAIMKVLEKIRGNLTSYFWWKILNLQGFICYRKLKKRLHDVSGRS